MQLFKTLDRDGDGEVSVDDFEAGMDSVGTYVLPSDLIL